jgi:hypothetical protein
VKLEIEAERVRHVRKSWRGAADVPVGNSYENSKIATEFWARLDLANNQRTLVGHSSA